MTEQETSMTENAHIETHANGNAGHPEDEEHGTGHGGHAFPAPHPSHEQTQAEDDLLTVRAVSGLSGDMMLAGLASLAELTDKELQTLVGELKISALEGSLSVEPRTVNHVSGTGCRVDLPHEHAHRNLADILKLITASSMPEPAKGLAARAFTLLGEAEAAVHGTKAPDVTFHEVGALDSILDICLVCRLFLLLRPARFVCSPLPLADGVITCAHGRVPSPAPAVLRLLEGVPVRGFSGGGETVTPTALSLLKALDAEFGPWPAMTVRKTTISYGTRIFTDAPNGAVWALGCPGRE